MLSFSYIKSLEDKNFVREKAGVEHDFGVFPRDRMNPNGGSVALGHPFAATGVRILSQAVKELAAMSKRKPRDRQHLCRRRLGNGGVIGKLTVVALSET